jgi:hypothetical protein
MKRIKQFITDPTPEDSFTVIAIILILGMLLQK